jgi:integrase
MENLLTKEQADWLRAVLQGHHLEALMMLAFVTGMRRDELLCVRWQDIDLSKRELRVLNSKTKRDQRVIYCEDSLVELLAQHRLRQWRMQLALFLTLILSSLTIWEAFSSRGNS